MDHVDSKLTDATLDEEKYSLAIRIACELAKKTLNRYYSLTDQSITYRVAMGKPRPSESESDRLQSDNAALQSPSL